MDKALAAFEKLLPAAPVELIERCKMYISTCQRQLEKHDLTFLTPEEHYDYAVSQLNTGYFEEAREQFNAILSAHPGADYAFYGLALLDAMTGRAQDCLRDLAQAIDLNPKNRLQARVDNDFQSMADDPRFTELLYPEVPLRPQSDIYRHIEHGAARAAGCGGRSRPGVARGGHRWRHRALHAAARAAGGT